MKKTISALLVLAFLFGMMQITVFSADAVEDLVPANGHYVTDVYVQQDLPQETRDRILAYFYDGAPREGEQDRNILCTLFGHNNQTSETVSVSHNVYTTSPKCVRNVYTTYTCTRCGNVETVLTSSTRISTCHG